MIFVLVPIALFAGLLAIANRRANRELGEGDGEDDAAADQPDR
jgi:hypothetical protein